MTFFRSADYAGRTGRRRAIEALPLGILLAFLPSIFAQNVNLRPLRTNPSSIRKERAAELEPQALNALKAMSSQLVAAKSFSFSARVMREEPGTNGQMLDFFRHIDVQVQRPNKLRLNVKSDTTDVNLWYDGNNVTLMPAPAKIYTVVPTPGTIDTALAALSEKLNTHMPLRPFLSSDPYAILSEGLQSANEIGIVKIGDEQVLHLAFREPDADWQLWLTGPKPALPHRLAIIYKNIAGQPRVSIEFSNWNLNPQFSNDTFTFSKPQGAAPVDLSALRLRTAQQEGKSK